MMHGAKRSQIAGSEQAGENPSILSVVVAFALAHGMELAEIQDVSGMVPLNLANPDIRIPDEAAVNVLRAVHERTPPDIQVGLELARAAPFRMLGGLAHGIEFASTLREALEAFARNRRILADRLYLGVVDSGDELVLEQSHPKNEIDGGRFVEAGAGLMLRLIREVLQCPAAPARVELQHQPAGRREDYEAVFRVPVLFGMPRNALIMHRKPSEVPLPDANQTLFSFVIEHFAQEQRRIEALALPMEISRLKLAITQAAARGDYRATTVANLAGLKLRAAQRIAARHDTTLHDLIDEVRATNAKAFLANPQTTVEAAGLLLGYSDDRAFRRAFRRWTGTSPAEFRRRRTAV